MGACMLKIPLEEIIAKIKAKTQLSEEVINKKIDEKVAELSGLVSKEGAAHIVANEFGVQLFKLPENGTTQIKDILPGLKSVSFVARVVKIFPTKEFKTPKKEGKVASFIVGDGTGKIRVVFWDTNFIKMLEDGTIKEGDVIKITNCVVKSGLNGIELHATNRTRITVNPPEGAKIPQIEKEPEQTIERKNIAELSEGNFEIRGVIVHLFETANLFYEVCSVCGKRMYEGKCQTHGAVSPKHSMVISTIVDDGTGNIRVVFFGNAAEQLLGMSAKQAFEEIQKQSDFLKNKKEEILGKEIICQGKVANNSFSKELEMICRRIAEPDPVKEAEKLLKAM